MVIYNYRRPAYLTSLDSSKIDTVVFHHTGNNNSIDLNTDYHMDHNGWNWLGYGFYIVNGVDYMVRGCKNMNAGVEGHNDHTISVAIAGNYNIDFVSQQDILAGQEVIDYIAQCCPNLKYIKVHSDFKETNCAGANFPIERFKINKVTQSFVTFAEFEKLNNKFDAEIKNLQEEIKKIKEFLAVEKNIRVR